MREILFRGKCVKNGLWVEGTLIIDERGNCYIGEYIKQRVESAYCCTKRGGGKTINRFFGIGFVMVIPETVGQYTGLTDKNGKNGKKIFEGDVFRLEDEMLGIIIFQDGCFRLKVYGLCGTFTESGYDECGGGWGVIECEPIDWYNLHDMEIIGNIHDNPELLK